MSKTQSELIKSNIETGMKFLPLSYLEAGPQTWIAPVDAP